MGKTKQRRGYQLKQLPGVYPRTPQQQKFLSALEFCEIRKGISKIDMMDKMKNCLPKYYEEHKE